MAVLKLPEILLYPAPYYVNVPHNNFSISVELSYICISLLLHL